MSQADVAIGALQDLSRFPAPPDRLQQGLLNELYLGRAMISPSGFTTHPAFHQDGTPASGPVLDTSRLYYNGNSLLPRSVDFNPFAQVFHPFYPERDGAAADPRPDPDARTIGASAHRPVLFAGAIQQSDDCGGGPCFAIGFSGP